jgi:hypothetical protein
MVDTDVFPDNLINFPARWHDAGFSGVLPKGTPVAQCIPVKREAWAAQFAPMSPAQLDKLGHNASWIARESDVYRRNFRAQKR